MRKRTVFIHSFKSMSYNVISNYIVNICNLSYHKPLAQKALKTSWNLVVPLINLRHGARKFLSKLIEAVIGVLQPQFHYFNFLEFLCMSKAYLLLYKLKYLSNADIKKSYKINFFTA